MAKHITVSGKSSQFFLTMFKKYNDIVIDATFNDLESMANTILENGVSFLHGITSISVVDYGFKSGEYTERLKEFLMLQDALRINNVEKQNVRLYIITKDADFYREVKRNPEQYFIYLHAEVYLIENKYTNYVLAEIIRGGRHKRSLYNPELDSINLESRLEQQAEKYIQETKAFNSNIIKVEKEDFLSEFAREEYMDSPVASRLAQEEKQRKLQEEKQRQNKKNKKQSIPVKEDIQDIESDKIEITIKPRDKTPVIESLNDDIEIKQRQQTPNRYNRPKPKEYSEFNKPEQQENRNVTEKDYPEIYNIKKHFDSLAFKSGEAVRGKLETDKGVLSITSFGNNGASSIVANMADVFAVSDKSVLIIDLDVNKKTQTSAYFTNYLSQAKSHYGFEDGLIKCLEGGSLHQNAVEISSRISILGLPENYPVQMEHYESILDGLDFIIDEAKTLYDIVLIDVPEHMAVKYFSHIATEIDKNIFILDNKFHTFNQFVSNYLPNLQRNLGDNFMNLVLNSDIILNKYSRDNLDLDGKESSSLILNKMLQNVGYPFDRINIVGELPYYTDWDKQFSENLRYVWSDYKVMGIYRYVMSKVVW